MSQAKQRRVSQPSDIDAKIRELKEKRERMLDQRGRRYARIADQAGLLEVQISDDDLLKEFKEIAARFRTKGTAKSEPVATAQPSTEQAHAAQ
jgi:TraC-like protein